MPAPASGLQHARHAAVLESPTPPTSPQFIEQLKAASPTLEDEQRAGRALLWDKRIDRDAQAEYSDARVPQQPYVYQTK